MGGAYAADGPEDVHGPIRHHRADRLRADRDGARAGLFKKFGIESIVSKEASWAVIRDKLSIGENQATHMLIGMPLASTMGLAGSPVKPMVMPWLLNRNGQAITLNNTLKKAGVKKPADVKPLAVAAKAKGEPLTFAMTFPPAPTRCGCATGWPPAASTPTRTSRLITIPPPQMVANMKVDKMDGFCVGEPWNNRAIEDGIGYTVTTTQAMWKDHPEKVCAFTEEFADEEPEDGEGHPEGAAPGQRRAGQDGEPAEVRRGDRAAGLHQLPARDHHRAADGQVPSTATAASSRIRTT